jgi:RNA polymerase sigma-70 factor (ECF subfamily)
MNHLDKENLQRFKLLYDTIYDKLYLFISRRTNSEEEAKDLVQEVFLRLLEKPIDFSAQSNTDSLVFTIARNLIVDSYRKKAVFENHLPLISTFYPTDHPAEAAEAGEDPSIQRLNSIKAAVEALPEQRKIIFKLNKYNGLSSEEIAEQLSLSKRTVENHLYRALKSLKKQLSLLFFSLF